MAHRTPLSFVTLAVGAIGFGVLMGTEQNGASFWTRVLLASAAGAWLGLWCPFVGRAESARSGSVVRWSLFAIGVVGFGLLMGLRDTGPNMGVRALVAGVAMAWLGLFVLARVRRPAEQR